eukprot:CAMPEP_0195077538 /NCGR_PEP_ID=MMETSP0448-20130528/19945_1 /TAXON_ID=66468 /ORGANISM="Heterocapsa triquestra, Strain CCMP 448" /LENGTH=249 /DNA_ID=CAMNT_0040110189 /DNA_START=1 /DNA_END=746 /DNA_ORIENTATION=+
MKLKKKLREIEDLERKMAEGVSLAANQQAKLQKKEVLLEELDMWEKAVEPHTVWHEAQIVAMMEPLYGVLVKVDGHTEPKELSAAHMSPPIPAEELMSIEHNAKYRKGNDLKVRIMRNQSYVTDMTEEEEAAARGLSDEITKGLEDVKKKDEKLMEQLWHGGYSAEQYDGVVSSLRDYCIFVRVLGREVKVAPDDMKANLVWTDPTSRVRKVKRDNIVKGTDVQLRLKWDERQDRVIGSMILDKSVTVG